MDQLYLLFNFPFNRFNKAQKKLRFILQENSFSIASIFARICPNCGVIFFCSILKGYHKYLIRKNFCGKFKIATNDTSFVASLKLPQMLDCYNIS